MNVIVITWYSIIHPLMRSKRDVGGYSPISETVMMLYQSETIYLSITLNTYLEEKVSIQDTLALRMQIWPYPIYVAQ